MNLNNDILNLNKDINLLKQEKEKELMPKMIKYLDKIKSLEKDSSEKDNNIKEYENEIEILKKENEEKDNNIIKINNKLSDKIKEINNIKEELNKKSEEIISKIEIIEELNNKIKIKEEENKNINNDKLKIEKEKEELLIFYKEEQNKLLKINEEIIDEKKNQNNQSLELIKKYSLILKQKENEASILNKDKKDLENKIDFLENEIERKKEENETIESENDELKTKNKEFLLFQEELEIENEKLKNNNSFLFNLINKLYNQIDNNNLMYNQFNSEVLTINKAINISSKEKKPIKIDNLLNLIKEKKEEENKKNTELIDRNDNYNTEIDININGIINEDIFTNEEKLIKFKKDFNNKIENSNKRYLELINSYISALNILNENIKEENILSNGLNKMSDNIFNKLLPKDSNSINSIDNDNDAIENEKRNINLLNGEEMIDNMNNLINKAINKIHKIEAQKDEEINSLHERLDYFIKEMRIIKESNEALVKDQSSEYQIQKEKYEKQLKIKDETIKRLEKYIFEQNKEKQEGIKNVSDLTEELKNMKEKYEMQTNNFKNIGQRAREQNERSAMKDISTGKYVINEYLNKLKQFANGLYNFNDTEM